MSRFDVTRCRDVLLGDCGFNFDLSRDIESAKSVGGRGSSADAFLGTAIKCIIVGLDNPARKLLEKARQWVLDAISEFEVPKRYLQFVEAEPYILDGGAAHRYQTLALCNWLLHNEHDGNSLRNYVELQDRFLAHSPAGKDKVNVALTLPTYVDAGAYQRVLHLFASSGLKTPNSRGSVRNEGQMAYVLCRYQLGEDSTEAEVNSVTRKFLDSNVDGWLINGHFVRAAEWMKIVYWQEGKAGISAKVALLKCYDHLVLPSGQSRS